MKIFVACLLVPLVLGGNWGRSEQEAFQKWQEEQLVRKMISGEVKFEGTVQFEPDDSLPSQGQSQGQTQGQSQGQNQTQGQPQGQGQQPPASDDDEDEKGSLFREFQKWRMQKLWDASRRQSQGQSQGQGQTQGQGQSQGQGQQPPASDDEDDEDENEEGSMYREFQQWRMRKLWDASRRQGPMRGSESTQEQMWREFQKWKEQKEWEARQEEEKKKEALAEEMEEFKQYRMMQQAQQLQAQKEEEQRRKAMEALQQKQNLIRQMANLTAQFQEQKLKLLHGVTYQFLEFCKCSDTSAMLNRFFSESFGVPNGMDDWSLGMKVLGDDGVGFGTNGSAGSNSSYSWSVSFNSSIGGGSWSNVNGSASGGPGSNSSFGGSPDFNSSGSWEQSFNGSIGGSPGGEVTTSRPPANVTVTNDEDLQQRMERDQMEAKAKRFYQMDQKQRAKELFSGLVTTLCERASEYVESVKSFEQYYIMYSAAMEQQQQRQQ